MSIERTPQTLQEVGGNAQQCGETAQQHDDVRARENSPATPPSCRRKSSASPARDACRRRRHPTMTARLPGRSAPLDGANCWKSSSPATRQGDLMRNAKKAYAVLQRVVSDPVEAESLRRLLKNLWDAAQSTSPEGL